MVGLDLVVPREMFSELWVPELETSQSNNSTRFYDGLGGHTKEDVKAPVKARSIKYALCTINTTLKNRRYFVMSVVL